MYFRQERNIAGKVSSVNNLYWTNIRTSVDSFNRENRIALLRYLRYKMRHFPWGDVDEYICISSGWPPRDTKAHEK